MLVIVRNDSHVHQAKLNKRERKKRKKNEQYFPFLERSRQFSRSFVRFLSRLILDCPDGMYKEYPYAPCRAQHHGYEDGRIV